jgi:hypothetical protein
MWRRIRRSSKAPVYVALILAVPLLLEGLMVATLGTERAHVLAEWTNCAFYRKASNTHGAKPGRCFHDYVLAAPTGTVEAKIWLLALAAPLILIVIGTVMVIVRYGVYVTCGAAAAAGLLLLVRVDTWALHHTQRFPYGIDLIRDSSPSNVLLRGEWEHQAVTTAKQMGWFVAGFSALLAGGFVFASYRHRKLVERMLPIDEFAEDGASATVPGIPDSVSDG